MFDRGCLQLSRDRRKRALIIGGGIAGLSAAIAMERLDWEIVLVERATAFTAVGTGISLAPNALFAFRQLGLAELIRAAGYWQRRCVLRAIDGSVVGEFDVSDWTNDRISIHRGHLQKILLAAISRVQYKLGTVVREIDIDDTGVRVRLSDGSSGRYSLVVAADGYRSDLRARLRPGTGIVYTGSNVWRVAAPTSLPDGWTWQLGAGRWLHAIRVGQGIVYATADIRSPTPLQPLPRGELTERFSDFGLPLSRFLKYLDGASARFNAVYETSGDTWSIGRVVFVGDAAHALPPILGQGAAMAAEDAIVLGQELASRDSIELAVAAYESRRHARLIALRKLAHFISSRLGVGFEGSVDKIAALLRLQDEAVQQLP